MNIRNVAIYARVSTEHEAQLSALENQVQYYDNILSQHPNWVLYDKYIDEGITGTSTKKRKSFMRMLEDAEKGYFDLIITREVSRFARNTVDTLQETRKLRRKGIEVWFTEDNIWTMNDEDGELRLTIMATLAQNESKKTSLRVKAGQMVSFQNAVPYGNGNILGYDRVNREYVINEEQAKTVKMIFDLYLAGNGERAIQFELERLGRLTSTGKTHWFCSYIGRILNNPFYCGTIVYRKEYVPDFLEQKKIKNNGDVDHVIVEGKHTPIITKEEFAKVQQILQSKKQACSSKNKPMTGYKASADIWCQKMFCECGCKFNRKTWHRIKDEIPQYAYQCYNQIRTGTVATRIKKGLDIEGICTTQMIPRWKLDTMVSKLIGLFFEDRDAVIRIAQDLLERNMQEELELNDEEQIREYKSQITREKTKLDHLLDLRLADEITKEQFAEKKEKIETVIGKIEAQITELENRQALTGAELEERIKILKYALEENFTFDKFYVPDAVIDAFVDHVVVHPDRFEWHLKMIKSEVPLNCLVEGSKKNHTTSIIVDEGKNWSDNEMQHRLPSQKGANKIH